MIAYKCDRCGGFYERNLNVRIKETKYKIDCYSNTEALHSINLCESCKQSFIDWFTEYKGGPHDKPEDR